MARDWQQTVQTPGRPSFLMQSSRCEGEKVPQPDSSRLPTRFVLFWGALGEYKKIILFFWNWRFLFSPAWTLERCSQWSTVWCKPCILHEIAWPLGAVGDIFWLTLARCLFTSLESVCTAGQDARVMLGKLEQKCPDTGLWHWVGAIVYSPWAM